MVIFDQNLAQFKKKQYFCGMKQKLIQILVWLGLLFVGTVVSVMLWTLLFHGSTSVGAQKWLQFFSVIGTFLIPPIVCAYLWDADHRADRWLQMDRGTDWRHFVMAIGIMIVALPAINLFAYLNSLIPMPQSAIDAEGNADALLKAFLDTNSVSGVLVNLGLLALLPALAEEMTFRGVLQQVMSGERLSVSGYRKHIAIWVTAIVFSAIHMQFLGFIPRMLMGALFGYMFVWTGTLWIPIVMHFTNNAIGILLYNSNADTMGAGDTIYVGVISLIITCLGLLIFYRRTHKQ